jgi:hypothetical protein
MSTLKVGSIQDLTGKPLVEPTGSILQIVNTNTVGSSNVITTTSATYVTTGFSLSITPKSASSKLLVIVNFNTNFNGAGGADDGCAFKLYRNGAAINTANAGDNLNYNGGTPGATHIPMQIIHYVNSNNTNPSTFELFFTDQWGGTATFTNNWGTNSITIMEIAA